MGKIVITPQTTGKEIKDQFKNEFGGTLRVYSGRSEATDDETLVSLGAKIGSIEFRASRTVGSFCEEVQKELNLKVKVATVDNWVMVLDGITLATIKDIPKQCTKAQMDEFIGYLRNTDEKKYKTEEKVNTEENDHESLKLATSEFNKDGVPLVSINLIGKYFANYQEAYWSEYWETNSGTGVVMIVKQNDEDKQLFNDVLYLEAHDENIVNELEIFHDDDEEYCENAMWQCIVFYQRGSEDYSEDVWRNTCKALQLIFKPERSSVDGERYDGPKAIFNIKAAWSDEDGDEEDSPFYNCNFRIYKNDKDEWVSKQLD